MTKSENAILEARDPAAYIDASLRARLSPAAKARLAKAWMKKTGYTKEDILHARNRHPFWKKKKMVGSAERMKSRLAAHDYSGGVNIVWTPALVERFLDLNAKNRAGRYEHRDWEIAEIFGASIPSIQYMRRKHRRAVELLGSRASRSRLVEYLGFAESVLIRGAGAVEELRSERTLRAKEEGKLLAQARPGKAAKTPAKAGAKGASKGRASTKAAPKPAGKATAKKRR